MSRLLKPQVMETIKNHRSGDTCDLMLDRNRKTFFAEWQGERFEDATASKVEQWIREVLESSVKVIWIPIVEIEIARNDDRFISDTKPEARLAIKLQRYYVARMRSGEAKRSNWELPRIGQYKDLTDDEIRMRTMERHIAKFRDIDNVIQLPHWISSPGNYNGVYITIRRGYLAYSEELWEGLSQIQRSLEVLAIKLEELVRMPVGQERIMAAGGRIIAARLPEPAPAPKPEEPQEVKRTIAHFSIDPDGFGLVPPSKGGTAPEFRPDRRDP